MPSNLERAKAVIDTRRENAEALAEQSVLNLRLFLLSSRKLIIKFQELALMLLELSMVALFQSRNLQRRISNFKQSVLRF